MCESIFKRFSWCNTDVGQLVLRIGVGAIFIFAGYTKAADLSMTVGFFATMGFSAFWAYLVTAVEILGGLGVLLGVCVRCSALLLTIVMAVAIYLTHGDLNMAMTPITIFFATLSLVLGGGGKYVLKQ